MSEEKGCPTPLWKIFGIWKVTRSQMVQYLSGFLSLWGTGKTILVRPIIPSKLTPTQNLQIFCDICRRLCDIFAEIGAWLKHCSHPSWYYSSGAEPYVQNFNTAFSIWTLDASGVPKWRKNVRNLNTVFKMCLESISVRAPFNWGGGAAIFCSNFCSKLLEFRCIFSGA